MPDREPHATVSVVPGRACVLPILIVALAACDREGPEDAAIAVPGTGIPVGAVGAVGVGFDAPAASVEAPPPRSPEKGPRGWPGTLAPDPFADPPSASGGPAKHPRPPPKGTTL